nr:MAG TPA: hypothetical protein [Caudoviricetes sp.]
MEKTTRTSFPCEGHTGQKRPHVPHHQPTAAVRLNQSLE